jgi:hypothetical protein
MATGGLEDVARTVVRRARQKGFVLARDIRAELAEAGLPERKWKQIITLARGMLDYRQRKYYYKQAVSAPVIAEQKQQRAIRRAIRQLIRTYAKREAEAERRQQDRFRVVLPIRVQLEDQRELTLLSHDLSVAGIRLIAPCGLLGQKLDIFLPRAETEKALRLRVRILWTCAVGDGLFENGGIFLEVVEDRLKERVLSVTDEGER